MDHILTLCENIAYITLLSGGFWYAIHSINDKIKELKVEIPGLRNELKKEIFDLRTELKSEIHDLRTELKTDIQELKTENKQMFQALCRIETILNAQECRRLTHDNKLKKTDGE